MNSGVYQIKNVVNDKIYVGSAIDIDYRWSKHVYDLKNDRHHNIHLQRAWSKYGEDKFVFEILELTEKKKEMILEKEQFWMNKTKCFERHYGYNIYKNPRSPLGIKRSRAFREKLSKIAQARVVSEETKEKISLSMRGEKNHFFGKNHTEESKKKMGRRGEEHFKAKLNWDMVREVRARYSVGNITLRELGDEYGVHNSQISRIINNKIWRENHG